MALGLIAGLVMMEKETGWIANKWAS